MIEKILRKLFPAWLIEKGYAWFLGLVKAACYLCPIQKDKVLFINFNGKGYGCNPKYIAQEILRQKLNYDLVWLVDDLSAAFPAGIRKVGMGSLRAYYELATSHVIVTNVKCDLRLIKKKKQYVIQTWHGSYSSKLVEKEAERTLSPQYIRTSRKNSRQTDLFLSNSKAQSQCYRDSFWCECEIMECGYPRNDILFHTSPEKISQVKAYLNIPDDTKIVIYAPTFRDDGSVSAYALDCRGVLGALEKSGEKWCLLLRMHPNVKDDGSLFETGENIVNASAYPDMQELLLVSDILITDYSSTVFEFAAMGKCSYIFAADVEAYRQMRGLKEDFFRMPYPVCRTNEELIAQLQDHSYSAGKEAAKAFMDFFGGTDRGDAAERVVERIREVMTRYQ